MYGGTELIDEYIGKGISVMFICTSQPEKVEMWHRARDYYEGQYLQARGRTFHMVFNNRTTLRLLHIQNTKKIEETVQGFSGVVIIHPELLFEHGKHEELLNRINFLNLRHQDHVTT